MGILTAFATGFVDAANQARNEKEQAEYDAMINARDQKQKESFYKFTSEMEAKVDKERAADLAAVQASQQNAQFLDAQYIRDDEAEQLESDRKEQKERERAAIEFWLGGTSTPERLEFLLNVPYEVVEAKMGGENPSVLNDNFTWSTPSEVKRNKALAYIHALNPSGTENQEIWNNSDFVTKWIAHFDFNDGDMIGFDEKYRYEVSRGDKETNPEGVPLGFKAVERTSEFYNEMSPTENALLDERLYTLFNGFPGITFWDAQGGLQGPLLGSAQNDRLIEIRDFIVKKYEHSNPRDKPSIQYLVNRYGIPAARHMEAYAQDSDDWLNGLLEDLRSGKDHRIEDIEEAVILYRQRVSMDNEEYIEGEIDALKSLLSVEQRAAIELFITAPTTPGHVAGRTLPPIIAVDPKVGQMLTDRQYAEEIENLNRTINQADDDISKYKRKIETMKNTIIEYEGKGYTAAGMADFYESLQTFNDKLVKAMDVLKEAKAELAGLTR